MKILTLEFWILVLIITICVNIIKTNRKKQMILLMGSSIFYLICSWKAFGLLLVFSSVSYVVAINICKFKSSKKKIVFRGYLLFAIGILGAFKYFKFFAFEFGRLLGYTWNLGNIIVPVGLSFYILTAVGYVVDVYSGKYEAEKDFLAHMVFLLYFPKMASGPIERGKDFFIKIKEIKSIDLVKGIEATQIILFGLIKKIVIADRLGVCVDAVFAHPHRYSAVSLIFAMLAYTIQIYCDFSGYTDIAVGVSQLMGIPLSRNFDLPYCAKNPGDFWRRWHISLSSWFKDYVYIPLGGSKNGKTNRNLMATMLLSGIWHGANWTFWIWGVLHGLAQCIYKYCYDKRKIVHGSSIINFIFVMLMWTIFRADSLNTAFLIFKRILMFERGISYYYVFVPIFFFLVIGFQVYEFKKYNGHFKYITFDMTKTFHYIIITLEIIIIVAFGYFGDTSFIYGQF